MKTKSSRKDTKQPTQELDYEARQNRISLDKAGARHYTEQRRMQREPLDIAEAILHVTDL